MTVDAYDRTQQKLLEKGKLITIDNQIDTVTGTVKLRAQFDNSKGMLFPNQFVNTRLLVKTLDNQTLVPSSAIQHNGSPDFVYLIQGRHKSQSDEDREVGTSQIKATPRSPGSSPETWWPTAASKNWSTARRSSQSKVTIPSTSSDTTEGAP